MDKPIAKQRPDESYIDFWEASKYIAEKLGVKSLRDFAGRYASNDEKLPYQDFWHFICDIINPWNGSSITMPYAEEIDKVDNPIGHYPYVQRWQAQIIKAFVEEFGVDAEYWVEW